MTKSMWNQTGRAVGNIRDLEVFDSLGELSELVLVATYVHRWNKRPDFMTHFVLEIRWRLPIGDSKWSYNF